MITKIKSNLSQFQQKNLIIGLLGVVYMPFSILLTNIFTQLFLLSLSGSLGGFSGLALAALVGPLIQASGFIMTGLLAYVIFNHIKTKKPISLSITTAVWLYWLYQFGTTQLYIHGRSNNGGWPIWIFGGFAIVFIAYILFETVAVSMNNLRQACLVGALTVPLSIVAFITIHDMIFRYELDYFGSAKTHQRVTEAYAYPLYQPTYSPSTTKPVLQTFGDTYDTRFSSLMVQMGRTTLYEYSYSQLTDTNVYAPKDLCSIPSVSTIQIHSTAPNSSDCQKVATLDDGSILYIDSRGDGSEGRYSNQKDDTFLYVTYLRGGQGDAGANESAEMVKMLNSLTPLSKNELR